MLRIGRSVVVPADEIEITAVRAQGAGGQNVNKVSNAVHLRFDIANSASLPEICKTRLLARRDQRISSDGVVVIKAQQFRSLERNKQAALERLRALLASGLEAPKPRKQTRPPRRAVARRLEQKGRRGALKKSRSEVGDF